MHTLTRMRRPEAARACPHHFLLAVEVLEAAASQDQAELLDGLAFPSGLEPQQQAPEAPKGESVGGWVVGASGVEC